MASQTLGTRLGKARATTEYLFAPGRDIELFGMFGAYNLGDDAMLHAGRANLPAGRVVPVRESRFGPLAAALRAKSRKHILVGGGTLVHGGDDGWLRHVELRVRQGAKLSLFGTGVAFHDSQIDPPSDRFTRWGQLLQGAGAVALRGPLSVATVAKMGVEAEVFGDFAFLLFDPARVAAQRGPNIGFNIGRCLGDQDHYERLCTRLLQRLAPEGFVDFFVLTPDDTAPTLRVIAAAGLAPAQYRIHHMYDDPYEFLDAVRGLRLFVGMKLHGSGLAMVAGAPALLFSYLSKCHDFVLPIGMEHSLIDLAVSAEEAAAKVEDALARPDAYRAVPAIDALSRNQRARLRDYFG